MGKMRGVVDEVDRVDGAGDNGWFSDGTAVHNIAGMAGLAPVLFVGARRVAEKGPHSIPLVALGTGLLWFGWYGFDAGSELQVDSITALAFVNTDIAASCAAISWLVLEWTLRPVRRHCLLHGRELEEQAWLG